MPTWEEHIEATYKCKCFKCPGLYANEIMNFVGFRGHKTKAPKGSHSKGFLNTLDRHGEVFEGESEPVPEVPITDNNLDNLMRITGKTEEELERMYYLGILDYEVEIMTLKFMLKNMRYSMVMILMGRGLGKTWMEDWENSIRMKYFAMNILLLSESDAGKDVGDWIYNWAFYNKYVKKRDKGAKGQTYLSFTLHNGAKLYVYGYMDKHSLGKHRIQIVGDDIVNLDWQNRPADERRARQHWHSNLDHMNRSGFDIWGTCKYEGDLLGHFQNVLRKLVVIKISPFKSCSHQLETNDNGVFEECHICKDGNLLAPELHSYEEYMDKKEGDYDAWYSEQMQNPYRKEGGMLEPSDIYICRRPLLHEGILMGGTAVDSADTLNERNDMVGIVSALSERYLEDKRSRRKFTVYRSDVARRLARNTEVKEKKKPCDWVDEKGRRIVRGIFESLQLECEYFQRNYPNRHYAVVFERNKSGIALIEQALLEYRNNTLLEIERGRFVRITWPVYLISDRKEAVKFDSEGNVNVPLGITSKGDKEKRIYGGLQHSIKEGQTQFTEDQKNTVLMEQLLSYPKGANDDGPDALEMIKSYLNRKWKGYKQKIPRGKKQEAKQNQKYAKGFQKLQQPWLKDQQHLRRKKSYL
jgi:hypothetical protein